MLAPGRPQQQWSASAWSDDASRWRHEVNLETQRWVREEYYVPSRQAVARRRLRGRPPNLNSESFRPLPGYTFSQCRAPIERRSADPGNYYMPPPVTAPRSICRAKEPFTLAPSRYSAPSLDDLPDAFRLLTPRTLPAGPSVSFPTAPKLSLQHSASMSSGVGLSISTLDKRGVTIPRAPIPGHQHVDGNVGPGSYATPEGAIRVRYPMRASVAFADRVRTSRSQGNLGAHRPVDVNKLLDKSQSFVQLTSAGTRC